jgi:hypothetical protein
MNDSKSKIQNPNPKQIPNLKLGRGALETASGLFGIWSVEFIRDLDFGFWIFTA